MAVYIDANQTAAILETVKAGFVEDVLFHTLEFRHPSFVDESGDPVAVRMVWGSSDQVFRLETSATLDAGQDVTFCRSAFEVQLPKLQQDELPKMSISVSNVSRELLPHLRRATRSIGPIAVTYRQYVDSVRTKPLLDPPVTLQLADVRVSVLRVTGTAALPNFNVFKWPRTNYTATVFPQLAGLV